MREESRPLSHIADTERDIKASRTLEQFREKADGWMVADGEDLCPEHVLTYKDKLARLDLEAELSPLQDLAELRARTRDHWFVMCSHQGCENEVAVAYE